MYSISEAAKKLGVSRVTVYSNIEISELQPHVTMRNNVKYIDFAGFDILKEKLRCNIKKDNRDEDETLKVFHDTQMLQSEIEHLKRELTNKDKHIGTLTYETQMLQDLLKHEQDAARDLRKLIENGQVLLKQEQERNTILIESSEEKSKKRRRSLFNRG